MQRFFSTSKGSMMRSVALSLVFSTLFIGVSVGAATTISTNISTAGTLSVTGTSALTGLTTMVYASSTGQSLSGNIQVAGNILANGYATTTGSTGAFATAGSLTVIGTSNFTGLATLVYASSTGQSLSGNLTVGGRATTTGSSGNIETAGTLTVVGTSNFTGLATLAYASSTGQSLTRNLMVNGMATTTGSSGNVELRGGLTVGDATTNSLAGTVLLAGYTTALEPTGVTQGTVYYNSTNKTLKMFDGSNWFTVGTTTGGLSLNTNNIRLDDVTLRNITIGTTTQPSAGKALVTLEATTTASIPLSIVGYASQTAHLLDILNGTSVAGPKLLFIDSSGGLFASSTGAFGGTLTVGGVLTATTSAYLATTGGTVGVATTTPGATFSVQGNGLVSGTLTAATFVSSTTGISTIAYASTTAVTVSGTASTTKLIVGGDGTNGNLAGIIFGTCNFDQLSQIAATTTQGVACTSATGITTAFKVFVSATSSIATTSIAGDFVISGASSTAVNTIGVQLTNLTGSTRTPTGTLNFWAVR